MTTPTATRPVTGNDRYAAYRHQRHYQQVPGAAWFARLIEDCRQAEAFPNSYTAKAVAAAQQVLLIMGEDGDWAQALRTVDHIQQQGWWYAHHGSDG